MSRFSVRLFDRGRCEITHELAGSRLITDLPPEYGGGGRSFSATDLVSAALGACVLTSIDNILEREGHDPKKVNISVAKTLSENPGMIQAIHLEIGYPETLDAPLIRKLERAMATCPVKRSLNEQVEITMRFRNGRGNP